MKYDYHVALMMDDGTLNYVTSVDNATKSFLCENDKPALRLIKSRAENLLYGMLCNGFFAVMLTVPQGCYRLVNKPKGDEVNGV